MQESVETVSILNSTCDSGHKWVDILPKVALKMFNILGENLIAGINDEIRKDSRKRTSGKLTDVESKITKLQSLQK